MPLTTIDDIKQLGSIMCVWAHPDDESFSCAGIMMAAVANGQQTVCLTATKGERGVQDETRWPADKLGEVRARELRHALDCIGCTHHHWLGYPDAGCKDVDLTQASHKILKFIREYQPDSILTFGSEGLTGHDDHCTVSRWVEAAVQQAAKPITIYHVTLLDTAYDQMREADERFNIFFNIDRPPLISEAEAAICFRLPDDLLQRKYDLLKAMPSQYEAMLSHFDQATICNFLTPETFSTAN